MNRETVRSKLVESLSDVLTGPLSDTRFVRAEDNEGVLELFLSGDPNAWPEASFDVDQLADEIVGWFKDE